VVEKAVAQFIYLLLNNEQIRSFIDTITSFSTARAAARDCNRPELVVARFRGGICCGLSDLSSLRRPAMLSLKPRLCSMEHVKKHSHAEASKRIDERREQHYRRN
jgi:hypothetical protein